MLGVVDNAVWLRRERLMLACFLSDTVASKIHMWMDHSIEGLVR
jgi:hypothetical protein